MILTYIFIYSCFFHHPTPTFTSTLSLHDALPIFAMDDLAQDPGLGMGGPHPLEDGVPGLGARRIHRIQPPSVSPALEPQTHDLDDRILHERIGEVQLDQVVIALEAVGMLPRPTDARPLDRVR